MNVKIPFIILIMQLSLTATAQPETYRTFGKCRFIDNLLVSDTFTIGPGQLSKDGRYFLLGLLFDNDDTSYYDIYSIDLASKNSSPVPFNLHDDGIHKEMFQCSATSDNDILVFTVNEYKGWTNNDLGLAEKNNSGNFSSFRLLDEINDPLKSDAYPWISPDGLAIYYVSGDKLNVTQRSDVESKFKTPVEVDFEGSVETPVVSAWLTNNEKKLFFISANVIYYSERKNKSDPFSFPTVFTREFKDFEFISGISFSPDLDDMYLYYAGDTAEILHYKVDKP